jgi:hypothetical protein
MLGQANTVSLFFLRKLSQSVESGYQVRGFLTAQIWMKESAVGR